MSDTLLKIDNLSVDYETARGDLKALRDITFDVNRGEIVGIVGESGCGKSTLISSILRLTAPNTRFREGEVRFKGRDLLTLPEREMRALRGADMSIVFQDPMQTHNPVLSIGRQMVDIQHRSSASKAEKRTRAAKMLGAVGIPDPKARLDQFPHEFSGGMRQRIAIAMALMSEPDLLIADEPTTALDATLEVQIIERLQELQHELHCAILFISHHLGVIAELCDRVVVMYAGAVVESGDVREIFHHPKHPYTRRLIDCDPGHINTRARVLPTIPGEVPDLANLPGGCIFRDRCDQALPRCAEKVPPLRQLKDGHQAACWLNHEEATT
ncbi:Oligopeptide transport ATP-binding protein OppD [Aliiroseovarius sp. xm-v-225]|uniref:ABC transporter ATP-binding protein n=2 Tax=unclassified Aliiroseovarius TaxID=2623558 RepID=UPI00156988BF|nr:MULTISPECIES: ABC transporter ATP-binding protein [unclassified Aliiroseovarius]NRP44819.1 Oligopeptide transport ATP-binding protein OppD [Aliiroseovarius sp. xm-m-378]NRP65690.1 Oligopeptide transport ATP-binding protein OppD [Aliiroseovarius sp. xm-v-225]NRP92992.1 Oligopeptide transport ATP-binding protein OppD [Aliiroseovarius sp. xm-a-134]